MSDLITAEDFGHELLLMFLSAAEEAYKSDEFRRETVHLVGKTVAARDAHIKRNALETAAKAVCFGCKEAWPMCEREWTEYHTKDGRRLHCNALTIKKLIPETPAPAGKETNNGPEG